MKTSYVALLLSSALFLSTGPTKAHEDAPQAPTHQGMVSEAASGTNAELSLAGGMMMLYLRNHDGAPIASKDSSGEVILLNGGEKQIIPLSPSGENSLMAAGSYEVVAGSKALVKVTFPGKATEQFRFVLP